MPRSQKDDAGFITGRITLNGEYDLARRDEIAEAFTAAEGASIVIVDLSNVTYMDSSVLRELALLRLKRGDRRIAVVGANDNLRRILKISGIDRIVDEIN